MIETKRLMIREMTEADLDALYQIYDDEAAGRFLPPLSSDREEELEKLKAYIAFFYRFYGFGLWAVCEKTTGRMIGRAGLNVEEFEDEVYVTVGYVIEKASREKGFAAEAVSAILDYTRDELELPEVAAFISPENHASQMLIRKMGFQSVRTIIYHDREMRLYKCIL